MSGIQTQHEFFPVALTFGKTEKFLRARRKGASVFLMIVTKPNGRNAMFIVLTLCDYFARYRAGGRRLDRPPSHADGP